MALLVLRYLSNAASFVLCVFRRVKDHHTLSNYSPCLKKTCVRQVGSDKWSPPKVALWMSNWPAGGPADPSRAAARPAMPRSSGDRRMARQIDAVFVFNCCVVFVFLVICLKKLLCLCYLVCFMYVSFTAWGQIDAVYRHTGWLPGSSQHRLNGVPSLMGT